MILCISSACGDGFVPLCFEKAESFLMKIYTGKGDSGTSSLFSGLQKGKDDPVFEALGDVDELNAFIGQLSSEVKDLQIIEQLYQIQNTLFSLGAKIAMEQNQNAAGIDKDAIATLEKRIDEMTLQLPELHAFILPGGSRSIASCHICRAICRRAERSLVRGTHLNHEELVFINRLSDYFFVLARFLCLHEGVGEVKWNKTVRL